MASLPPVNLVDRLPCCYYWLWWIKSRKLGVLKRRDVHPVLWKLAGSESWNWETTHHGDLRNSSFYSVKKGKHTKDFILRRQYLIILGVATSLLRKKISGKEVHKAQGNNETSFLKKIKKFGLFSCIYTAKRNWIYLRNIHVAKHRPKTFEQFRLWLYLPLISIKHRNKKYVLTFITKGFPRKLQNVAYFEAHNRLLLDTTS